MAMVINTNIQSLSAQRNLTVSQSAMESAMDRLSSGKRINSAADDAAGLQIASGLTSQIRGLDQAVRNANDGISMVQTAEGALQESTNMLQRMRELAIQSASGTFTDGNRATLNAEVTQLKAELTRIAESTTFNGLQILDGTLGATALQVGSEANQTIAVDFSSQSFTAEKLGGGVSGDLMGSEITDVTFATVTAPLVAGDVKVNGKALGAYDSTLQNVGDLVAEFNAISGVSAATYLEETATSVGSGILAAGTNLQLTLTLGDGTSQLYQISDTENMDELVAKITETTAGAITASKDSAGKLVLASDVGVSLAITADQAGATGTLEAKQARLVLSNDDGSAVRLEGNAQDLGALGFNERSVSGQIEGADADAVALVAGDLTINDVAIGASTTGSVADKVAAINAADAGVTASVFSSAEVDLATGTTIININGTDVTVVGRAGAVATAAELTAQATAINAAGVAATHGATASVQGGKLVIEADGILKFGQGADAATAETNYEAYIPTAAQGIKLSSDTGGDISIKMNQTAANLAAVKAATGLLETNQSDTNSVGSAVSNIDISTAAGAQKAIATIDKALDTINSARGEMGAITNRLNFTVSNLSSVSQSASASRSAIEDADFAAESANLSRAQVLQQAGTAMLAQANAQPQQVLSLLQ